MSQKFLGAKTLEPKNWHDTMSTVSEVTKKVIEVGQMANAMSSCAKNITGIITNKSTGPGNLSASTKAGKIALEGLSAAVKIGDSVGTGRSLWSLTGGSFPKEA